MFPSLCFHPPALRPSVTTPLEKSTGKNNPSFSSSNAGTTPVEKLGSNLPSSSSDAVSHQFLQSHFEQGSVGAALLSAAIGHTNLCPAAGRFGRFGRSGRFGRWSGRWLQSQAQIEIDGETGCSSSESKHSDACLLLISNICSVSMSSKHICYLPAAADKNSDFFFA